MVSKYERFNKILKLWRFFFFCQDSPKAHKEWWLSNHKNIDETKFSGSQFHKFALTISFTTKFKFFTFSPGALNVPLRLPRYEALFSIKMCHAATIPLSETNLNDNEHEKLIIS